MLQTHMEKSKPIFDKRAYFLTACCSLFIFTSVQVKLFAQNPTEVLRIQAQQQIEEGKFGEAIDLLNRYISANPANAVGYNLRGLCFENRKEYQNAVYDFRSALKLEPENEIINENLNRAIEKWETILYNRIVGFKREIEINPDKPLNYLEVGKCFKNLGNWQQAEKWYDEYLKREDPSADELIRYTEILAKINHISKGVTWLKKYCEKFPNDHRLWSRYGYFTMWLGKKEISISAFKRALELRPYFKEALDGYDLVRGKGYIYTVNDTTVRYNYGLPLSTSSYEYPIDKYYRRLAKNPEDQQSRLLLIQELIYNNRFSEAENQLRILSAEKIGDDKISTLENEFKLKKESFYWKRISELEKTLNENPSDEKSTIELAHIYAEKEDFERGLNLLSDFKDNYPVSDNFLYNYALISSWAGDLRKAYIVINQLVNKNPDETDYQLLCGKLSVWLNKDLDKAEDYLEDVLNEEPNRHDALLAMSLLHLQRNDLEKAKYYLEKATEIEADDIEIRKIRKIIELRSKHKRERELNLQLEQARKYLFNKECQKSIEIFTDFLKTNKSKTEIKRELAEAYVCKGDYTTAIKIYDEILLTNSDNFMLRKTRAKLLYWSGNYSEAKKEFYKLSLINPDDAEVKLYLGDSYTALKDYYNAKRIYYELLNISPSSFILQERLRWIDGPSTGDIPTYIMLSPEVNYFIDNFDFLYSVYGLRVELGISEFLSLGASGYAGVLGSDSITNNISIFKGIVSTRFSDLVSANAGFGTTLFPDNKSRPLAEISVKVEKPRVYSFSANFYSMDAAQVLYSPFLVDLRLRSNVFSLLGNYITSGDWKFFGLYSFFNVSDENRANKLVLRLGKIFQETIGVGYEYYYYDVKDQTNLYWSPKNFESHSVWADWTVVENDDVSADIGGKLGYIPSEEFVLREFYGEATFRLSSFFSLYARLVFGSTVQSGRGYSSTSFSVSAFWAL